MIMAGLQRRRDSEVLHQALGVTGILGGNQRHLAQNTQRTGTDIVEVADGRGYYIQHPGGRRVGHESPPAWKNAQCTRFANSTSRTRQALRTIQGPFCQRIGNRPMISRLRLLTVLCLLGLLAACSGGPRSPAGDLPKTPQASVDQLLLKASQSSPREAALLRLAAADKSYALGNPLRAAHIIQQV